jgi:hypothetical protein
METRLSDEGREGRKEGNYDTTAERERMEPPRSMKDDTKQQHGKEKRGEIAGSKGKSVDIHVE